MLRNHAPHTRFGLVQDMLAVPDLIRGFDPHRMAETGREIKGLGRLLLTGEGSSRIFPAQSAIAWSRRQGNALVLHTEAARQSQEYPLAGWGVFALSNSGRTAEVIGLFERLLHESHGHRYSLTAFANSKLETLATQGYVLTCGPERAVAATKSVMEQALFYRALLEHAAGRPALGQQLSGLADAVEAALTTVIDPQLIQRIARARTIYWAGRNDGVAEELTLKTNEITRKSADYLEGTYALHGVEEVMDSEDVLVWVDPYPESEAKIQQVLVEGVGLPVIALAARETRFPTIRVPDAGDLAPFAQMAAGWNLLVAVGLRTARISTSRSGPARSETSLRGEADPFDGRARFVGAEESGLPGERCSRFAHDHSHGEAANRSTQTLPASSTDAGRVYGQNLPHAHTVGVVLSPASRCAHHLRGDATAALALAVVVDFGRTVVARCLILTIRRGLRVAVTWLRDVLRLIDHGGLCFAIGDRRRWR